jgi:hypothetical protein
MLTSAIQNCETRKDLTNQEKGIPFWEETQTITGGYPNEKENNTDRRYSQPDSRVVL